MGLRKSDNGWLADAACLGVTGYPFYTEEGVDDTGGDTQGADDARGLCDTCPVRTECLLEALHYEHGVRPVRRHGVWAGYTPEERYEVERAGHVSCPVCGATYDPTKVRRGLFVCPVDRHHRKPD